MKNKSKQAVRQVKMDDKKKKYTRSETDKQEIKRCFNCGNKNHLSASCPNKEKGIKCFRCEKYGHIATNCPAAGNKKTTSKDTNCNATHSKTDKC